jgi:phosphatidylcholine synthase
VHFFTACGAVVGAWALLAIATRHFRAALLLMLAAFAIDSVDGMLARSVGVSRALPGFDGRRLDDMVDYLNYVIVPVVFLVAAGYLPHWGLAAPPILASAYGFSQADAKTPDDFFLGFPSYWNVVALYAWLLEVSAAFCTALVLLLAALVFVPFKYVYPSRLPVWRRTTAVLMLLAGAAVAAALAFPERGRALWLPEISLLFPAWYLLLSLRLGGLRRPAGPRGDEGA